MKKDLKKKLKKELSPDNNSLEVLKDLHARSWENFYERRNHEYKFSIAIWTLYILTILNIVNDSIEINDYSRWVISFFAVILFLLYFFWTKGVAKTNHLDHCFAYYYGEKLRELGHVSLPESFNSRIKRHDECFRFFKDFVGNWNHSAEVLFTLFLMIVIGIVCFL